MNQKGYIFLLVFMAAITVTQNSFALPGDKETNSIRRADFDANWRFHLGDEPAGKEINFRLGTEHSNARVFIEHRP